jgi:hypothetical protein
MPGAWRRSIRVSDTPSRLARPRYNSREEELFRRAVTFAESMALTTHKNVTLFMTYVHTEGGPFRAATD